MKKKTFNWAIWLSLSIFPNLRAATSFQGGNWSDSATWVGGVKPGLSENALIEHTVTVDDLNASATSITIQSGGTLRFRRDASSRLEVLSGSVTVKNGGTLDMGTSAANDFILPAYTATLILSKPVGMVRQGLVIENGGVFTAHGAPKSPYGQALSGLATTDTSVSLPASAVAGWAAGDSIVIGKTRVSGQMESERRVIDAPAGAGPVTIPWSGQGNLGYAHPASDIPLLVSNLTRNVVVRSSGTQVTGTPDTAYIRVNSPNFTAALTEFAYLGANGADDQKGLVSQYPGQVNLSSCTVRDGYQGLSLYLDPSDSVVRNTVFHNNRDDAVTVSYFGNITHALFEGNAIVGNGGMGVYLSQTGGIRVKDNWIVDNNVGVFIYQSFGPTRIEGNRILSVLTEALRFEGLGSGKSTVLNNEVAGAYDPYRAVQFSYSDDTLVVGNRLHHNRGLGVEGGGADMLFIGNTVWSNGYGGQIHRGDRPLFVGNAFGYDPAGNAAANDNAALNPVCGGCQEDFSIDDDVGVTFVNTRVLSLRTQAFGVPGAALFSYVHGGVSGEARLWGDYVVSGSTLTLDRSLPSFAARATVPKRMRGAGHVGAVSGVTNDAVSQLVTVIYTGTAWEVTGSSTGYMGDWTGGVQTFPRIPAVGNVQFSLSLTPGGSLQAGDSLDFALIGSSGDADVQKKLLVEPGSSSLNGGKSRLSVAPGAGVVLRGTAFEPTLIQRAGSSGSYIFVSSGAFTAENARFQHADPSGIQLSGSGPVLIASTTFDNLGLATGDNAYITVRDFSSSATFSNVTFGSGNLPAAGQNLYNVRVLGVDTGLAWAFQSAAGGFSGPAYESDPNGKVRWLDAVAPSAPVLTLAAPSSNGAVSLTWTSPGNDGGAGHFAGTWRVYYSTDPLDLAGAVPGDAQQVFNASNAAGATVARDVTGLTLYATHYFQLWAQDETPNTSPVSNVLSALPPLTGPQAALVLAAAPAGYLPRTASLGVGFDKAVKDAMVPGAFRVRRVRDSRGAVVDESVAGAVTGTGQSFSFAPSSVLAGNSVYAVTVSSGVEDAFGAPSTSAVTALFTTMMDRTEENVWTDGTVRVDIPAGALAADGYLSAAAVSPGAPSVSAATGKAAVNSGDPFRQVMAGAISDVDALDAAGGEQGNRFSSPVTVSLPYPDADGDGIVDGTSPPVRVRTLAVHWLDEKNLLWVRLPSSVDAANRRVSAPAPHFTTFALLAQADMELSGSLAFPVPFTPASPSDVITFTGLPQLATIRVYTHAGRLVRELRASDGSGQVFWDVKNQDGEDVATGVYFYEISNGPSSVKGKLAVLR